MPPFLKRMLAGMLMLGHPLQPGPWLPRPQRLQQPPCWPPQQPTLPARWGSSSHCCCASSWWTCACAACWGKQRPGPPRSPQGRRSLGMELARRGGGQGIPRQAWRGHERRSCGAARLQYRLHQRSPPQHLTCGLGGEPPPHCLEMMQSLTCAAPPCAPCCWLCLRKSWYLGHRRSCWWHPGRTQWHSCCLCGQV